MILIPESEYVAVKSQGHPGNAGLGVFNPFAAAAREFEMPRQPEQLVRYPAMHGDEVKPGAEP